MISASDAEINPEISDVYAVMEECAGTGFEVPRFDDFYSDMIYRKKAKTVLSAIVRAEGMPVAANMWIQLLPQGENECAMRLTVKADLNFFIRQMVGKKLEQGVDGLAQMLASLPY